MAVRRTATVTQIAESAGVSISTVSRVLNQRGQVDEHTRKRVIDFAEKLGCDIEQIRRKNAAATEMPTKEFSVELLFCPLAEQKNIILMDFMTDILRGIQSFFVRYENVRTNLSTWEVDDSLHHSENDLIFNRAANADGLLLIGNPTSALIDRLVAAGISPVLISNQWQEIPIDSVSSDDFGGGVTAGRYLLERGYRKIGYLSGGAAINSFELRGDGIMTVVIKALGIGAFEMRTAQSSDNEDIALCIREWIASGTLPEVIVASHACAAEVICREFQRAGLRCPDDCGVVTFDSSAASDNVFGIRLTQLQTYPRELGFRAAQRIYQLMTSEPRPGEQPFKIVIPLRLLPGESEK